MLPSRETRTVSPPGLTFDEAIRAIRADPRCATLVQDVYLGPDVDDSARRFRESVEFDEVCRVLGPRLRDAVVLDIGSGVGIAARAFASAGAGRIYALEPDDSDHVGRRAFRRGTVPSNVHAVGAVGERLPVASASVDIVYCRQVLHHIPDLRAAMMEAARVLRPGGVLLACREHVVDDERQKAKFLRDHPVHRLAGGENAYRLDEYVSAIVGAGLRLEWAKGQWGSPINAYPVVRTRAEFEDYAGVLLRRRLGAVGAVFAVVPGTRALVRKWLNRRWAGRPYTFLATRP